WQAANPVNESGQRSIAIAIYWELMVITVQRCLAIDFSILAKRSESPEFPRCRAFDIFAPEHFLQFCAANLASESVHFLVGDGAEFALHVLGQGDAEFAFQQIRHAALAGLA